MFVQELDLFYKSCEWPAKIAKVTKEASSKAASDHKSFEQSLKARRKDFGESLGDLENRVAAFSQYDVISRRAEHATEVCIASYTLPQLSFAFMNMVIVLHKLLRTANSSPPLASA